MTAPIAVLLARLEHELTTAILATKATNYVKVRDALERVEAIAKQIREGL